MVRVAIRLRKSHREVLWFDLPTRRAFVNITPSLDHSLKGMAQLLAGSDLARSS